MIGKQSPTSPQEGKAILYKVPKPETVVDIEKQDQTDKEKIIRIELEINKVDIEASKDAEIKKIQDVFDEVKQDEPIETFFIDDNDLLIMKKRMGKYYGKKRMRKLPKSPKNDMGEIEFKNEQENEPRKRKTPKWKKAEIPLQSHSQKSATFAVTSITGVLTMQYHIKVCNNYLKNFLGD